MQTKRTWSLLSAFLTALLPLVLPARATAARAPDGQRILKQIYDRVNHAGAYVVSASSNGAMYSFESASASCIEIYAGLLKARTSVDASKFDKWTPGNLAPEEVRMLVLTGAPLPANISKVKVVSVSATQAGGWTLVVQYQRPWYNESVKHTLVLDSQYRVQESTLVEESSNVQRWNIKHIGIQQVGLFSIPQSSTAEFKDYSGSGNKPVDLAWTSIAKMEPSKVQELQARCAAAGK